MTNRSVPYAAPTRLADPSVLDAELMATVAAATRRNGTTR